MCPLSLVLQYVQRTYLLGCSQCFDLPEALDTDSTTRRLKGGLDAGGKRPLSVVFRIRSFKHLAHTLRLVGRAGGGGGGLWELFLDNKATISL